jgi:hypothetical protein
MYVLNVNIFVFKCGCQDRSIDAFDKFRVLNYLVNYNLIVGEEGQKAYGLFEVYKDKLKLKWTGKEPSDSMLPWANTKHMTFKPKH